MNSTVIKLEVPLTRGDKQITEVTLHKPNAGALRGVSLRDAIEMKVDVTLSLVPRISEPKLTAQEMNQLDACDLLSMSAGIANFLLPPSLIAEAEQNFHSLTE